MVEVDSSFDRLRTHGIEWNLAMTVRENRVAEQGHHLTIPRGRRYRRNC